MPSRGALAAPAAAIAVAVGTRLDLPVVCPFRLCTGHACPGCGLTRATGSLLRGDVAASLRFHPLAFVLVMQLAVVGAAVVWQQVSLADLLRRNPWLVWVNIAALLGTWVVRWRLGLLDLVLS